LILKGLAQEIFLNIGKNVLFKTFYLEGQDTPLIMLGGVIEEMFPKYSSPGKVKKDDPLLIMLGGVTEEMFPEYWPEELLPNMLGGVTEEMFPEYWPEELLPYMLGGVMDAIFSKYGSGVVPLALM
jgi:hypothetical protein